MSVYSTILFQVWEGFLKERQVLSWLRLENQLSSSVLKSGSERVGVRVVGPGGWEPRAAVVERAAGSTEFGRGRNNLRL